MLYYFYFVLAQPALHMVLLFNCKVLWFHLKNVFDYRGRIVAQKLDSFLRCLQKVVLFLCILRATPHRRGRAGPVAVEHEIMHSGTCSRQSFPEQVCCCGWYWRGQTDGRTDGIWDIQLGGWVPQVWLYSISSDKSKLKMCIQTGGATCRRFQSRWFIFFLGTYLRAGCYGPWSVTFICHDRNCDILQICQFARSSVERKQTSDHKWCASCCGAPASAALDNWEFGSRSFLCKLNGKNRICAFLRTFSVIIVIHFLWCFLSQIATIT